MANFKKRVLQIVSQIPKGETKTYMEIAKLSGSPRAARAVGTILKRNYNNVIPCHRVIRSDGKVGEYNRGSEKKMRLLQEEKNTVS